MVYLFFLSLFICCFTPCSRIFHLYGNVTIAGEGLQNLGPCSALGVFEQGRIFIVPNLLWHGTLLFPGSSEGPPHSVASNDTQRDVEDLFSVADLEERPFCPTFTISVKLKISDPKYPNCLPFSRGGPPSLEWAPVFEIWILTWILTGPHSVASYNTQRDAEDLFLPGSSFSRLIGQARWCFEPISIPTRTPTGVFSLLSLLLLYNIVLCCHLHPSTANLPRIQMDEKRHNIVR
jgi:hypothetical protein